MAFDLLKNLSLADHAGLRFGKTLQESIPLHLSHHQTLAEVVARDVKGSPGK